MLKVLFVTQDDPFFVPHFFDEFIAISKEEPEIRVEGAVIQKPLGKRTLKSLVKQMWDFYGPVDFLRVGSLYVVYKTLNIIAVRLFRGRFFGMFSLRHLLLKKGWNVVSMTDVNSTSFINLVRSLEIDLIVSVAASQIFKPPILTAPPYGCINVHSAKLPKNRGMLPNFWALYHYDTEPTSAITIHKMNEHLDDGEIILQEEFPLDPKESLHQLIVKTKRLAAQHMITVLRQYCKGEPTFLRNDPTEATYHTFPAKEDVARFRAKGLRLI